MALQVMVVKSISSSVSFILLSGVVYDFVYYCLRLLLYSIWNTVCLRSVWLFAYRMSLSCLVSLVVALSDNITLDC